MDLLSKSILVAIVLVVAIFLAYYTISHVTFAQSTTKVQAISLVQHDLENSNPGAAINITNVTPSQYAGSWHIVASVVLNATSPCPSYFIYSFDYPKYGFVYRVDNTYTSDCQIYGLVPGKGYLIGSYPVAITASYLQRNNISVLSQYINQHGYYNVTVHASYLNATAIQGKNYTGVWLVNYTTPDSSNYVAVFLSQVNGTPVATRSST